ncbi:hypothetical protein GPN2_12809 [Streptomyces murinus]
MGDHARQIQDPRVQGRGQDLHARLQREPGGLLRQRDGEQAGRRLRLPQPDARPGLLRHRDLRRHEPADPRPLPALVLADLQLRHPLRRLLRHLAPVRVPVPDQRPVPVVLAGLGRHDHHVLVRHLVQRPPRLPARPALAALLPRRVHLGAAGHPLRHHRHADPDPLGQRPLGLRPRPRPGPGMGPGRIVSAVT